MPVAINMPHQREEKDPLETIVKGLQIAHSIYGIKEAGDKAEILKQEMALKQQEAQKNIQAADRANQGVLTVPEAAQHLQNFDRVAPDTPGATKMPIQRGDETEEAWFTPKRTEKAPPDPMIGILRQQQYEANLQRQKDNAEKAAFAKSTEGKLQKLGTTGQQRLDNVRLGLSTVQGMSDALNDGDNTFSLIGDNNFTQQRALFDEALGRMQSGGAINKEEAASFRAMAPKTTDSIGMRQTKLQKLQDEMLSRMKTLGFQPEEFGQKKADIALKPPSNAIDKLRGVFSPSAEAQQPVTLSPEQQGITPEAAQAELMRRKGLGAAKLPR